MNKYYYQARAIGESENADFLIGQLVVVDMVDGDTFRIFNPVTHKVSTLSKLSAKRILRTIRTSDDKPMRVNDFSSFIKYAADLWNVETIKKNYRIAKGLSESGKALCEDDYNFITEAIKAYQELTDQKVETNNSNLTPRQQKQVNYLNSLVGNDVYARNTEHQMTCKCGTSGIYKDVTQAIEFVNRHSGHNTWHSIIHV